jgi:hypothetical protein
MIGNLKALGLAALACLAMSALVAPAASANPQFHIEMEDTTLTGGQITPNVLTTDLGELKCEVIKYDGTQGPFTSTTLTLTPIYEECEIGEINATVTMNGCSYVFHLGQNTENFEANMGIECPAGAKFVVHIPFCSITIPPQGGLQKTTFTNENAGATRSLIAHLNIGGIHYVEHGFLCPNETETTVNGTYVGLATVTGENAGQVHKGIWVG